MTLETPVATTWFVVAGVLAPGACIVRLARLELAGLERLVVALAAGRVALAAATLGAAALGATRWLPLWGAGWALAWLALRLRARAPRPTRSSDARDWLDGALVVGVALAVAYAVSGRSGVVAGGDLVFFGRHTTSDPLVYLTGALRLLDVGPGADYPLVAGFPMIGHEGFLAWIASPIAVAGLDPLDAALRVRPALDVASLGLAALALGHALGATRLGALAGALLLLVGGDLSQHAYALAGLLGRPALQIEAWGFGSAFSLPVNPIAPALATAFAALLLAAHASAGRAAGWLAGLLVASLFEMKAFAWPPFALALAVAWLGSRAAPLRTAAVVAIAAGLPIALARLTAARAAPELAAVGVAPCLGCLPRFVADWSFGARAARPELLAGERLHALGAGEWPGTLAALALFAVVLVGARWLALPALMRAARAGGPRAAVGLALLAAGACGLALAATTATPPHGTNAMQFAWLATFGWWPAVGVAVGRLAHARRRWALAGVALLALPSGLFWLVDQGLLARLHLRVSAEERVLLARLHEASTPADRVLEPSILERPDVPTPVAWLARRPVWMSFVGTAEYLAPAERERRRRLIEEAFGPDVAAARAALQASGARFVFAPAARPLAPELAATLERVHANAAGTVLRVP